MKIMLESEELSDYSTQTSLDKLSDFMNECFNSSGKTISIQVPEIEHYDDDYNGNYLIKVSVEVEPVKIKKGE